MGSSTVVLANIFREYDKQVSLAEDQHAVGEFGSQGAHEPFGEAVRPRTPRGIRTTWMPMSVRTASNDAVNCPARVDSMQRGDFMTKHQDLDVLGRRRTPEQQQEVQHPQEDQVEQTQRHDT
jgi:hypothetical protein